MGRNQRAHALAARFAHAERTLYIEVRLKTSAAMITASQVAGPAANTPKCGTIWRKLSSANFGDVAWHAVLLGGTEAGEGKRTSRVGTCKNAQMPMMSNA